MIASTPAAAIADEFKRKVCADVHLEEEGADRFNVYTPFTFDDGDHFVVVLKKGHDGWELTDEGHTFMHISYEGVDVFAGTRAAIVDDAIATHGVDNRDGILAMPVRRDDFGNALFSFLQAITKIVNVTKLSREKVSHIFVEDLRGLITEMVPANVLTPEWRDPAFDAEGVYSVDYRIETPRKPWLIFGIQGEHKCMRATIACYHFERHNLQFKSLAVMEDQTKLPRGPLAMLSQVVDRQFPSLAERDRIKRFISDEILAVNGEH